MRIAFLTPEYVTEGNFHGGLANYLSRIASILRDLGHQPIVIVASDCDEVVTDCGIEVVRVQVHREFLDHWGWKLLRSGWPAASFSWRSWKLNRRLRELHRSAPVDLVQYTSYCATALFRLRHVPAVVRISSIESLWDSRHGVVGKPGILMRLKYAFERVALRRADILISPSRIMADKTRALIGREVAVVESPYVAPDCVFDRRRFEASLNGRSYALFFGSVSLLKGVYGIAAVLDSLLSAHPDLHFAFIGRDLTYLGRPMMDHVREKARKHTDRVHYFEPMRHDELYPFIENARVVVLPSRVDNFPNSCLEAMALGRIVVGTRGASFDELIVDGVSGFLCEIDDPPSLLVAIKRALLLEKDARCRMELAARKRVAKLDPEHAGEQLLRIYTNLIENGGDAGCSPRPSESTQC